MAESREPHPLKNAVAAGEEQKKRLSHVEVKATSNLLSSVRQEGKVAIKNHVTPLSKQELLSAVRTEANPTKKRLSHVQTKAVSGMMSELRNSAHNKPSVE